MPLLLSLRGSPQLQVPVFKERAQLLRTGIACRWQLPALKSEGTGNELLFPPLPSFRHISNQLHLPQFALLQQQRRGSPTEEPLHGLKSSGGSANTLV